MRPLQLPAGGTYYPPLTGLRAVAALAVFGYHYRGAALCGVPAFDAACQSILRELHIGVSLFFTLSGFLITKRYAGQQFDRALWFGYLWRRAARLLPVYAVLVTVTFTVDYFATDRVLWRWLGLYAINLTLLKGLVEAWFLTGIGPAWSLTVEEGFYLLAPLVLWLAWRYGPLRAWPLLGLGMAALGLGFYALLPALGSPMFVLKSTIFGRLGEFLFGSAFAWAAADVGKGRATAVGGVAVLLVWALLVGIQNWFDAGVSISCYPGIVVNNWLLPAATGCLLYGLATEPTRLARWLSTPLWQSLGRASYCFYLLHMGLLTRWLEPIFERWLPVGPAIALLLGVVTLAALALHHGLEKPARRWLLARFAPASPASPALLLTHRA